MMDTAIMLVCLALVLGVAVWLIVREKRGEGGLNGALDMIKGVALNLILQAEQTLGPGTGQFKKASVIEAIINSVFYAGLPGVIRRLITYDTLSAIVDAVCDTVFKQQQKTNPSVKALIEKDGVQ